MKNTAAMDPGLVDSLRHSGHDAPRTADLPALWETLRESMGSFLVDSWEENMKCISTLLATKTKNEILLNFHLYRQYDLIAKEAINGGKAHADRLRQEIGRLFSTSVTATTKSRFKSRLRRLAEIPREYSALIACLNKQWHKILSNTMGGINDEILRGWINVIGPAIQHIVTILYLWRGKGDDNHNELRDEYISRDEESGLDYTALAKFGRNSGWTFADSHWLSYRAMTDFARTCKAQGAPPGLQGLGCVDYAGFYADEWAKHGLCGVKEDNRQATLTMLNIGGKPTLVSMVNLFEGDYLGLISTALDFGETSGIDCRHTVGPLGLRMYPTEGPLWKLYYPNQERRGNVEGGWLAIAGRKSTSDWPAYCLHAIVVAKFVPAFTELALAKK